MRCGIVTYFVCFSTTEQDDDDDQGAEGGTKGKHIVEQFTGVGIKVRSL